MTKDKQTKKLHWSVKLLGILAAVVILLLAGVRMWFRLPVSDYYRASEKAFRIPDCNAGFVAQGISYDAPSGQFFVTGYRKDGGASPIYTVERSTGAAKRVNMLDPEGKPFACHAGGLSVSDKYVYIASGQDSYLYVYDREAILSAASDASVPCLGKFRTALGDGTDIIPAFATVHDGRLWVGEFYREQNYPTPDSHKLTTTAGDKNPALAASYAFSDSEDALFGLKTVPGEVYSIPGLVQGMAFHDGKVFLSTSYALAFSHIYVYDEDKIRQNGAFGGAPLSELDSASLTDDVKLPPMSEEIEFVPGEDRLYTMCESASDKYIFGKLTGGEWCYATERQW